MKLTKEFSIESAHRLKDFETLCGCQFIHGHHYVFQVTVEGPLNHQNMVVDFEVLAKIVNEVLLPWNHGVVVDEADEAMIRHMKELGSKCATVPGSPSVDFMTQCLALEVKDALADTLPDLRLVSVRGYEEPDRWITWEAE